MAPAAKKAKAEVPKLHKPAMKLSDDDDFTISFAIEHFKIEDLRPEFREAFEKVKANGLGVCGKCRLAKQSLFDLIMRPFQKPLEAPPIGGNQESSPGPDRKAWGSTSSGSRVRHSSLMRAGLSR